MVDLTKEVIKSLINGAKRFREKAYAPNSNYNVGAALLAQSGKIYFGANVENSVYRATHAEKKALDDAIIAGERTFVALAVVTDDEKIPFPCGQCLQDYVDFDYDGSGSLQIFAANLDGKIRESSLGELLPERFGASNFN